MKHAGYVRSTAMDTIPRWPFKFYVLLCFVSATRTLTPPRIIYGGWTPILPGHPFYFGAVHGNNVEQSYPHDQGRYTDHGLPPHAHYHGGQVGEPPVHHIEHQEKLNNPGQYHDFDERPEIYPHPEGPRVHSPNKGHQISYGHKSPKDNHAYYPHESIYDGPKQQEIYPHTQVQSPNKGYNIPQGQKSPKDIFSYYPHQSTYDAPKKPGADYKPVYFEVPRKPLDIFEKPQQHVSYVPSLKDVPIKNLNLHNLNTVQHGDEKIFLKLTPLGNVDPSVIKHIGHLGIDQIQHLNPNILKYATYPIIKDSSGGMPGIPRPAQHASLSYGRPVGGYKSIQSGLTHVPYDAIHYTKTPVSLNSYKGTDGPVDSYQLLKRPLNPIETKYFRKSPLHISKLQQLSSAKINLPKVNLNSYSNLHYHSDLPLLSGIPTANIYPTKQALYSNIKYLSPVKSLSKPYVGGKNLLSPSIVGNSLTQHMKKYFSPRYPHFNPVQPFYPSSSKLLYPPVKYRYNSVSKNLGHLPLRTLPKSVVPKVQPDYLHKDVQFQPLYKNPGIVTGIEGTPALVDKELTIIRVPVTGRHQYVRNTLQEYPDEKEYLFYTASTPESTQIRDTENSNKSISYITLNKNTRPVNNNASYTHTALDYGREQNLGHITSSDLPENDNSIGDPPYQNQFQYIFVSSNGIDGEIMQEDEIAYSQDGHKLPSSGQPEGKKQFFHAYYAPGDHIPPPGYVRMTVQEFNNLFKNAEIRYVDKDPASILHNNDDRSNQRKVQTT